MDVLTCLIREQPNALLHLARTKLLTINETLNGKLAEIEQSHYLHTEADVGRASDLYLINPVNIAIQKLLPRGGRIFCRAEQVGRKKNRTDRRWTYRRNGQSVDIAILELKAPFVLKSNDFKYAMVTTSKAREKNDAAQSMENSTHLKRNAITVAKQTKKYADDLGVTDIAVFDWNAMFVFDYNNIDYDSSNPRPAKRTWFRETDVMPARGHTFRSMLLGLLIRGLQKNGIIN